MTDRYVLMRLTVLCGLFALVQTGVGLFMAIILFGSIIGDKKPIITDQFSLSPTYWNLNSSLLLLTIFGFILLLATILARKAIQEVNLTGALRFYFVLLWIFPIEFFLVLTLIDIYGVSTVWVDHWWNSESFFWFREIFCREPEKCFGFDEEWCVIEFNATDCHEIQQQAMDLFKKIALWFYIVNGVWGVLLIIMVSRTKLTHLCALFLNLYLHWNHLSFSGLSFDAISSKYHHFAYSSVSERK